MPSPQIDFINSNYTAIISDLHLCEAEPINKKYPLWKKYKTREFFFDEDFADFLKYIETESGGQQIELVLNGDIFDFDSVTQIPENPTYQVSYLEKTRGLDSEEQKSIDKIKFILRDHPIWVNALSDFISSGHKVVFVIGNHDLEIHWDGVKKSIMEFLDLEIEDRYRVRFVEWFYISNKDTLIEHGNQYDPYCQCEDPLNPFILDYNKRKVRLPFGDWASRYLVNVMGFFNPHADSNYLMTIAEYAKVFFKYMLRAQPLLVWTWFSSSILIFVRVLRLSFVPPISDPLVLEARVEGVAQRANATKKMVREMGALFVQPASSDPIRIAKELWLDRAFLLLAAILGLLQLFIIIDRVYDISVFWIFIPLFVLLPPFMLYSRSVSSYVHFYKRPDERLLLYSSLITQTKRVVYGHTHSVLHEIVGGVEHLNAGTWSPAFLDVECEKEIGTKTFVWITPDATGRQAKVLQIENGEVSNYFLKK